MKLILTVGHRPHTTVGDHLGKRMGVGVRSAHTVVLIGGGGGMGMHHLTPGLSYGGGSGKDRGSSYSGGTPCDKSGGGGVNRLSCCGANGGMTEADKRTRGPFINAIFSDHQPSVWSLHTSTMSTCGGTASALVCLLVDRLQTRRLQIMSIFGNGAQLHRNVLLPMKLFHVNFYLEKFDVVTMLDAVSSLFVTLRPQSCVSPFATRKII